MKLSNLNIRSLRFTGCINYALAVIMAASMAACSDEIIAPDNGQEPVENGGEQLSEAIYFSLNLQESSPGGTRAGELMNGTENALDNESELENVIVILADLKESAEISGMGDFYYHPEEENTDGPHTFRVLAYAEAYSNDVYDNGKRGIQKNENGTYTIIAKAENSDFEKEYGKTETDTEKDFYIFVIANNKSNTSVNRPVVGRNIQRDLQTRTEVNYVASLLEQGLVGEADGYFVMTSDKAYKISLSFDELKNDHFRPAKALNLNTLPNSDSGPLTIHRMVARLDQNWYQTKFAITAGENGNNISTPYTAKREGKSISYIFPTGVDEEDMLYSLTIDAMAVMNMSQNFMLFQEVGTPDPKHWDIFGREDQDGVYMRDPKGDSKANSTDGNTFFQPFEVLDTKENYKTHSEGFLFRTFDKFNYDIYDIKDNWKISNAEKSNEHYAAVQYVLPNSVHDASKQFKKNTTGVIYRAIIDDNALITDAKVNGDDVFALGNDIWGNYANIKSIHDDYAASLSVAPDAGIIDKEDNPVVVLDLDDEDDGDDNGPVGDEETTVNPAELRNKQIATYFEYIWDEYLHNNNWKSVKAGLETKRTQLTAEKTSLEESLKKLAGDDVDGTLTDKRKNLADKENELTDPVKSRDDKQNLLNEKLTEKTGLQNELTTQEKALAESEAELEELRKEENLDDETEGKIAALVSEIEKLEEAIQGKKDEITTLQEKIDELQNELNDLNEEIASKEKEIKKLIEDIDEIVSLQTQIAEKTNELEEINNRITIAGDTQNNLANGNNVDQNRVDPVLFREAAKKVGVRTYQASKDADGNWVYYCYYYYWIRHKNNGNNMLMAPMEFSIVRNYVYKLAVSKIYDLGYPEDPGDDPDPEDPNDEVEDDTIRILVDTEVLPWGVRVDDNITLY